MEKRVLSLFIFSLLFAIACQQEPKQIPVTGITLSQTSVELTEGESTHISATVSPSDATNLKVIWSSDSPFVTVADGYINGIKPCIATVTATTDDGGKTATCNVKVIAKTIAVTGISLDKTSLEIKAGDKATLIATVYPNNATNMSFFWSSSNESIATVSDAGLVTGISSGSAIITATTVDGGMTATCTVKVIPAIITPTAIDLGLSVKWASFNLGASKPEEYGNYYSWGEVVERHTTVHDWVDYKWSVNSYYTLTKYNNSSDYGTVDNKTILDPEDDAAHVILGGTWRMPTDAEFRELIDNCSAEWTTEKGVNGYRFTSIKEGYTDNSVFFPATGYRTGNWYRGTEGCYWSSSLHINLPYDAELFRFYSNNRIRVYGDIRTDAQSIRPVCPKD